ncbi:hypothetical protein LMH87_006208 [Akanthomyces muscarius]|uniref:Coupling of ubiquitin conjugation to ER degradation protein 1 n=1 Tax=Akanthomyces muscarius TaxID=2231603 RepID=A0A9W8QQP9_AKAMU|nr:hypothetical protein LMH87_006208 [Akanthomyces muscarius]KAJ4164537.1 hypothetical protein LMH87_006208 [Akanthomyces muscarius]
MANEQISLPYFVGVLVFAGLVIRYLFFSGTSSQPTTRSPEAFLRSREAAVERIQQMFPQTDRRSILWDLQRNGGNIQSTTERILSGRMEAPPVTFQPPPPPGQSASAHGAPPTRQADKPSQPDLITRYNLKDKLDAETQKSNDAKGKGWSSNREERQASLQRRRDEMILAARKKMQAKMATETTGPAAQ